MADNFSIKRFLPRTLFGRSLLILITPVVLIQIITSFIFFDRHWSKMTTRLAFAVSGELAVITNSVKDGAQDEKVQRIVKYAGDYLDLFVTYEADARLPEEKQASGVQIWEGVVADKLAAELAAQIQEPFIIHTDFPKKMIEVFIQLESGLVSVSFPQRRLFSSSGYVFLLWMIGTSFLLLIIAILFMRNQIRPIRKLAAAAERFGKGRDTPFFKPEGAREVRQAGKAFMDMRRRIERQIGQRTDMLAGVSHDLRTPLTRMKLQVEMMPEGQDKDDMRQDILDMERMVHGYLDFVRGDGDEQFETIDVPSVLQKIAGALHREKVAVELAFDQPLELTARPLAFERAMSNLMSNAAKYAQHIWVNIQCDEDVIQIEIDDDGPGIPQDQYGEVFKPFTRIDVSRNTETGGVGLGLPIAQDIVHAHGGKIHLEESAHGGLRVIVRLPT